MLATLMPWPESDMATYYKVDSRKLTLREYWNITHSLNALIPWIGTRIGMPMNFGAAFATPGPVSEQEIPEGECTPAARAKLQPLLGQCLDLGFHTPRYFRFETLRRDVQTHFISLLHRSGGFTLRLMHTEARNVSPAKESVLVVLLSELADGTLFFTSDQGPKFNARPGVVSNRLIGGTPLQLIQSHQEKVAQMATRNPPKPVTSEAALDEVWDRNEREAMEFQVNRGLYVPVPPEELAREQQMKAEEHTLTQGGVRHAEVLVEMVRLQNKKASWGNVILLLVVSLVMFVGAGSRQWSWEQVLMLVPILLIHESGHYLAMRAFDYRNLRMFFIPFFGAAVSGRHYNVPGWKKVVVSLAGPVPGIFLGIVAGVAGMLMHQPWLTKAASMALILNGINLLPVLPLDGGWVFHTLVFSRHRLLDAGFRVLAVIALILFGSRSDNRVLVGLGIFMLFGIPAAYRMASVAGRLIQRNVPGGSPDDQTVPTDTAVAIIDELKQGPPQAQTNKMLAQQTLDIFEVMNARPPRWPASIALFFTYFVSLGLAVVFGFVFAVDRSGLLSAAMAGRANVAKRPLVCGTTVIWPGTPMIGGSTSAPVVIVGNFPKRGAAEDTFRGLTNRLPVSVGATLFGNSVLLTLPPGDAGLRKQWFGDMQDRTKDVFVGSTNALAKLSLTCRFATEALAKDAEAELDEYFTLDSTESLIPPWLPDDPRTPEQRAAHRLARKTYRNAQQTSWSEDDSSRVAELNKQIIKAQKQGDEEEAATLRKKQEALLQEFQQARLNRLKSGKEGPVDPEVIDLYVLQTADLGGAHPVASGEPTRKLAARMGQVSGAIGVTNAITDRFVARSGMVFRTERRLQLMWVDFRRPGDGAPALADWLCAHGATDLKYDLSQMGALGVDEE